MTDEVNVVSAARAAATLRTVLAGYREDGKDAVPLAISESDGGAPEAVLVPYQLYEQILNELERREDLAIGALAADRAEAAPAPGEGLDADALARLVAASRPADAEELLRAAGRPDSH
ncbi:hypothetical protein SAMN05216251_13612 [Actinacidiphila alni]|uniref:Antitoxin n=1 Tax=Actinacidiphila alni TaxID=380248 RepID=A0A1I2MN85_9ACTN|nr:hypothetical protein [Actinacidiphila alni]SFF90836.1 hypothetical protein SAMN05216251_13612 [Actinacidiphila alni]